MKVVSEIGKEYPRAAAILAAPDHVALFRSHKPGKLVLEFPEVLLAADRSRKSRRPVIGAYECKPEDLQLFAESLLRILKEDFRIGI